MPPETTTTSNKPNSSAPSLTASPSSSSSSPAKTATPAASKAAAPASKAEMHEAAVRLGAIARFLADIHQLGSLDRRAIPDDPSWERSLNSGVLQSAFSRVYRAASVGTGTTKELSPAEQLAQYRRDFQLVVPTVFERARRTLPDQILAMTMKLVPLTMALGSPEVGDRVRRNLLAVSDKGGGLLPETRLSGSGSELPGSRTDRKAEQQVRTRLAPYVAQMRDPILSIIFAHPDGMNILREFAADGPRAGQEAALRAVYEAGSALSDLYTELTTRPIGLWRAPRLIWLAAEAEGLAYVADLRLFLTAIGAAYLHDKTRPWLTFASIAFGLLAMIFAPPVGIGTASLVFSGLGLATQALELPLIARADLEQNVAATATGFEVQEARLGARDWSATGLAATMLLISAIVIFLDLSMAGGPAGKAGGGGSAKRTPPGGGRWTSPGEEAAAITSSSRAASHPPPGETPPSPVRAPGTTLRGLGRPPGTTPRGPGSPPAAAAPASGSTSATTPLVPGSASDPTPPGSVRRGSPGEEAAATAPSSRGTSRPAPGTDPPAASRSVPEQASGRGGPHAGPGEPGGAPAEGERSTADVAQRDNAGLAGARGTATDAVAAERAATRRLLELLRDNPVDQSVQEHISALIRDLRALPDLRAAEAAARFELVQRAMSDPKLLGRVVGRVRAEMDVVRGLGPPTRLEQEAGLVTDAERAIARLAGWTEESGRSAEPLVDLTDRFYDDWVASGRLIIDRAFPNDHHGKMIHAFHDLVVDAAFEEAGMRLGASAWRRSLVDPGLSSEAREIQRELWEEIFDSTRTARNAAGDHVGTFNRPETLNPLLDEVLGGLLPPSLGRRP